MNFLLKLITPILSLDKLKPDKDSKLPTAFIDLARKLSELSNISKITEAIFDTLQNYQPSNELVYTMYILLGMSYAKSQLEHSLKSTCLMSLEQKINGFLFKTGDSIETERTFSAKIYEAVQQPNSTPFVKQYNDFLKQQAAIFAYFPPYSFIDINLFRLHSYEELNFLKTYLQKTQDSRLQLAYLLLDDQSNDHQKASKILADIYQTPVTTGLDHTHLLELLVVMLSPYNSGPESYNIANHFDFLIRLEAAYKKFIPNGNFIKITQLKQRLAQDILINDSPDWQIIPKNFTLQQTYQTMPLSAEFLHKLSIYITIFINGETIRGTDRSNKVHTIIDYFLTCHRASVTAGLEDAIETISAKKPLMGWVFALCSLLDNLNTAAAHSLLIRILTRIKNHYIEKNKQNTAEIIPNNPGSITELITTLKNAADAEYKSLLIYLTERNPRRIGIDFNAIIDFIGTGKKRNRKPGFLNPYHRETIPAGTFMPARVDALCRIIHFLEFYKKCTDRLLLRNFFFNYVETMITLTQPIDPEWTKFFSGMRSIENIDHYYVNAEPLLKVLKFVETHVNDHDSLIDKRLTGQNFSFWPDENCHLIDIAKYWHKNYARLDSRRLLSQKKHHALGVACPLGATKTQVSTMDVEPDLLATKPEQKSITIPRHRQLILEVLYPNLADRKEALQFYIDEIDSRNLELDQRKRRTMMSWFLDKNYCVNLYILSSLKNEVSECGFNSIAIYLLGLYFSYQSNENLNTVTDVLQNTLRSRNVLIEFHKQGCFNNRLPAPTRVNFYPRLALIADKIQTSDLVAQVHEILKIGTDMINHAYYDNFIFILNRNCPETETDAEAKENLLASLKTKRKILLPTSNDTETIVEIMWRWFYSFSATNTFIDCPHEAQLISNPDILLSDSHEVLDFFIEFPDHHTDSQIFLLIEEIANSFNSQQRIDRLPEPVLVALSSLLLGQRAPIAIDLFKQILIQLSHYRFETTPLNTNPLKFIQSIEKNSSSLSKLLPYLTKRFKKPSSKINFSLMVDFIATGKERNQRFGHDPYRDEMIPKNTRMPARVDFLEKLIRTLAELSANSSLSSTTLIGLMNAEIRDKEAHDPKWAEILQEARPATQETTTILSDAEPLLNAFKAARDSTSLAEFQQKITEQQFSLYEEENNYIQGIATYWHKKIYPELYLAPNSILKRNVLFPEQQEENLTRTKARYIQLSPEEQDKLREIEHKYDFSL